MDKRPPHELTRDELRTRIIARSLKVFRDCEQAILDAEYWNGLPGNQQHMPMDVEDFRIMRASAVNTLYEFGITPKSRLTPAPPA